MGGQTQELRGGEAVRGRFWRAGRALACGVIATAIAVPAAARPVGDGEATKVESKEHRPLGAPLSTEHTAAPRAGGTGSPGPASSGGFTRTAVSLAVVLGLIWLCAAGAKRFLGGKVGLGAAMGPGGRSPAGLLEVLGRYPVGRGQTLVLLKLDRRLLLLSQAGGALSLRRGAPGGGLTTLCEISNPDEVASILVKAQDVEGESISAKFNSLLSEFGEKREDDEKPASPARRRTVANAEGDRVELMSRPKNAGAGTKNVPGHRDAAGSLHARLGALRAAAGSGA